MNPETMRLAKIMLASRANGPGLRDVYWTAGCSIGCPGCINPDYLTASGGIDVSFQAIEDLMQRRVPMIEGITLSGGEPTDQPVAATRLAVCARQFGLSVVLFTGRTLEACRRHPMRQILLSHCDVVIAGPYVQEARIRTKPLIGSTNQQLHFLSGRYSEDDFSSIPNAEILISGDWLSVTGVYIGPDQR